MSGHNIFTRSSLLFVPSLSISTICVRSIPISALIHSRRLISSLREPFVAREPYVAPQREFAYKYHDVSYPDPYHYLMKKDHKLTKRALRAENSYSNEFMSNPVVQKYIEAIENESISRLKETDQSFPVRNGEYFYYSRTEKGKQYPIQCRRRGENGKEEIVIDMNQMEYQHVTLGVYRPSPDNHYVAYSLDVEGSEQYELFIKDMVLDEHVLQTVKKTYPAFEWASNDIFFCVTTDDAERPDKIWRFKVGQDSSQAECLIHEPNPIYRVDLTKSFSGKYVFVSSSSISASQVYYIPLTERDIESEVPRVFKAREKNMIYEIQDAGDDWIILHNYGAVNFKICKVSMTDKESFDNISKWIEIENDPLVYNVEVKMFKDYLVAMQRRNGTQKVCVYARDGNGDFSEESPHHVIEFKESAYSIYFEDHLAQDYNANILRFKYSSIVTPPIDYSYDLTKRELKILKQTDAPGLDPSLYTTKTIYAPLPNPDNDPPNSNIPDKIPIVLVYRTDMYRGDGTNPALVEGYGSYGIPSDPRYRRGQPLISLLDRGYVYAIPFIRGGSECGYAWYSESGKLLRKKNTFYDFIASIEYIVKEKVANKDLIAISGGSAGGLLIGAVLNMRPDIAKVFVAKVPFVDVLNTMMNEKLPLTINEYEEWGNPKNKAFFDYIRSYSPMENIRKDKQYPNGRFTSSLFDPRVGFWEPAKFLANLRHFGVTKGRYGAPDSILTHECKLVGGHSGSSGRYDAIKDDSKDYAFIMYFIQKELRAQKTM